MLVDVATAKPHLRVADDSQDAQIEAFLRAAEEQATLFLDRNVYEDQTALDAALAALPALSAAQDAYDAALAAVASEAGEVERTLQQQLALDNFRAAQDAWTRTVRGMVVTDSIRTAILLITASLWEHRGDEDLVQGVPPAARMLLWPYRIGLGV